MENFKLNNKNETILTFSVVRGIFQNIQIYNPKTLPFYLASKVNLAGDDIKAWLEKRCISQTRPGLEKFMASCKCTERWLLSLKNHALSLTDPYWIEGENENLDWNQINFYKNNYSNEVGDYLLGIKSDSVKALSPDICTNGVQPKIWLKEDGVDFLYKFGRAPFFQEPFNEVICSEIALAFKHLTSVEYTLSNYNGTVASKCQNFITEGLEYVPALYIYNKRDNISGNMFMSLIKKFRDLNIVNAEDFMYEMTVFDSIINNTDRNLGNFGLLRDTDTGEFLCMAPIFDNGNSMWFDEDKELITGEQVRVQPMNMTYKEMFNFIKRAHIDFELLDYQISKGEKFIKNNIEEERADRINACIMKRFDDARDLIKQIKFRNKERYNVR